MRECELCLPLAVCMFVIFSSVVNVFEEAMQRVSSECPCPVARTLTCVPPISTTSTLKWEVSDILRLSRDVEDVILGTINPGLQLTTASLSAALLEVITAISSFQDLTNDFAPSS